jgi:hypothetical protein
MVKLIIFLLVIIFILVVWGLDLYLTLRYERKHLHKDLMNDKKFYFDGWMKANKTSRIRAQLLKDITDSLYYGEDLKDKTIREFYVEVWNSIQWDIARELKRK